MLSHIKIGLSEANRFAIELLMPNFFAIAVHSASAFGCFEVAEAMMFARLVELGRVVAP